MRRLYFDVTFTRTQASNVGITRTVKRLYSEFERLAPASGLACVPVAYHTAGFRALPAGWASSPLDSQPNGKRKLSERALHWIANGPVRDVVSRHFPLPLRRLAWLAYSWWDFNRLARDLPSVDFKEGDVLFLGDASWNYPVWREARDARRRGARVVTVLYDLIPVRQPQFVPRLTTIAFEKWLGRVIPWSDVVLCISKSVEDDLHRYASQHAMELHRTASFRLGCDPLPAGGEPLSIRAQLREFLSGAPCFTAIGSVEPRKNYGFILDVFEKLWRQGVDARLLILGRRTVESADLLQRIERHSEFGARLLVMHDANDSEVAFAYAGGRALLFASLAEGFGLPLVEARARGSAVIASDLPAFAELADEGVSLFPAGSANAMEKLVLSHLRSPCQARASEPFTWTDTARQCLAFIQDLQSSRQSL